MGDNISGKSLKFDGKNFVLEDEWVTSESEEKKTIYKDDNYEEELSEEDLKEMEHIAREHMNHSTPTQIKQLIEDKLDNTKDLSKAMEQLKDYYVNSQPEEEDPTNPSHYKTMGIESIDLMEVKYGTRAVMMFCMLNVEKYTYRAGRKGSYTLDMKKAEWYLNKYKELKEKEDMGYGVEGVTEYI